MRGRAIRLSRLLPDNEKTIVVAIDHGQTFGPMEGLVDLEQAALKLREAHGVLLAPHMVRFSGDLFVGRQAPVPIVRLNWNTIHCEPWGYQEAHIVPAASVRTAVAAGADVVLASLVVKTGDERLDAVNVKGFSQIVEATQDQGIPLIGEVFPVGGMRDRPDEFHDYVKKACRIVCELGADAIKTFCTGDRFAEVIDGTPIPILALGAEKLPREIDALRLAQNAVQAGARGVVFGRNVLQASDSSQFLRGLKAVVQSTATPEEAAVQYGLT